jgi:hypothetical protein
MRDNSMEDRTAVIPIAHLISDRTRLIYVCGKVLNRNLARLLVLIYSIDYLEQSPDAAQLFAAVSLIQTLLSNLNRGILTIGISNNQKEENSLSSELIMESSVHISLLAGGALSALGIVCAEELIPYIIPGAGNAAVRQSMRLYTLATPTMVALLNVPSALLGVGTDRSDLPILGRELIAGGAANLVYFLVFRGTSLQSFAYTILVHASGALLVGRLLLGAYGDMKITHFFHRFKEKMQAALHLLRLGFVEGILSGVDVFGWMVVSWAVSQQADPRYLLSQLSQLGFATAMIESLTSLFRKDPPSRRLLLAANGITAGIGIGLGSLLLLIKGVDPTPSIFSLTLLPLVGKRVITQAAMDKSQAPAQTNKKMVNAHLVISLLTIGLVIAAYFLGWSSEHIILLYPLVSYGLGMLSSAYYLAKKPEVNSTPTVVNSSAATIALTIIPEARSSAIGLFSTSATKVTVVENVIESSSSSVIQAPLS